MSVTDSTRLKLFWMVMGMADCNKCIHLPVCCRLTYCLVNGKVVCNYYLESKQATSDENKRWIPVTERLPENLQRVLIFRPGQYFEIHIARMSGINWEKWDIDYRTGKKGSITHWMPLPEPPKET